MTLSEAKTKIVVGGIYRHFKGRYYKVLNLARHSETGDAMVVYQALYEEQAIWVRPAEMWLEEIKPGVRRFKLDWSGFAA